MVRFFYSIKVFLTYWMNIFVYNHEGWYIGDMPPPDAQNFRMLIKQKLYHERTCKMCKRKFWSYKKPDMCFRMECFLTYHRRKYATDTCKN